jgi:hypothetical protein
VAPGVLVESITIVAAAEATNAAITKPSHTVVPTEAAAETTHVASAAEAAHSGATTEATTTTKTSAVATAATAKTSAVTATAAAATTAASFGGSREQARCEKGRCQYRDRSFHHDTPVDLFGAVPRLPTSHAATERRISVT